MNFLEIFLDSGNFLKGSSRERINMTISPTSKCIKTGMWIQCCECFIFNSFFLFEA